MLGIFDSGMGGKNTLGFLRKRGLSEDVMLLCDRARAPFGRRSREEIIEITEDNLSRLRSFGARRTLIACCTASSVYPYLSREARERSVPIISAVAERARQGARGNIAVIATQATVSSHAFGRALAPIPVTELAAGSLVDMIEGGAYDGCVTEECSLYLDGLLSQLHGRGCDTLILGCTHFSSLSRTVARIAEKYGITEIIDSAREGAYALRLDSDCPGRQTTSFITYTENN